jgi:DNA-binding HxlR family transcriptional regulator
VAERERAAAREVEMEDTVDPSDAPGPVDASAESVAGAPLALDTLIHERARLGIVSALAVSDRLAFTELRQILDITDGNLSAHARKLEDAGYIECRKSFAGRVPRTDYRLTPLGRARLTEYLAHMEALIQVTREG